MRRRLVIAIAGVAAIALLLFAIPLAIVVQRTIVDAELLRLQRDTVAATREIDLGERGDPIELPKLAASLAVYDVHGSLVAGSGPQRSDEVVARALRSGRPVDGRRSGELLVAVPLLAGERVTGVVRAARDDGPVATDVRQSWLLLAAVGAVLLGFAVLSARVLAARLAVPLERLSVAARRLGDGDFSVRAPRANIAEVDAVAAVLDATAARLHDLVSRERAFTADASHQLRTPLAALRIEVESLQLRDDAPELRAALTQIDRLEATIDTLLNVARDARSRAETTDLEPILDELQARWRGALAAGSRPLRIHGAGQRLRVSAPAGVVVEILDVLLDNASRHGAGAVTVAVRETGPFVTIDVQDHGAGFSVGVDEAFERRHGSGGGYGIGLALARSLAHAEGGRLEVLDAGREPVVRLMLPLARARAGAGDPEPAAGT